MIVGSYIEIKYKTKGGEIQYSTQEVLQFGYSERYGCQVVVVDKDSPYVLCVSFWGFVAFFEL